jgi:glutamate-ammonia-ligase adenylyltransferase
MGDRLDQVAAATFAPRIGLRVLTAVAEARDPSETELNAFGGDFLRSLAEILILSPPMLDSLRSHPEWLVWLQRRVEGKSPDFCNGEGYDPVWEGYQRESEGPQDKVEQLRAFKRRECLEIAFLDVSGRASFQATVRRLSALADCVIEQTLRHCWSLLRDDAVAGRKSLPPLSGFAVIAMGKLGGNELNYSSDIDLIFCRRDSDEPDDYRFYTRLGERLVQALGRPGAEGFLYRVDMRLRPHGTNGPLVPTLASLVNYYESWGEAWERQALIKARFVGGAPELGRRFMAFAGKYTFARQMDDSALEEIKRVKHRAEREYVLDGNRIHLKQGPGGIRDIEFYVQYLQLIAGWRHPGARSASTLDALAELGRAHVLLEGEESQLCLAYLFLRILEHRLQMKAFTPEAIMPQEPETAELLAQGLGFIDGVVSARESCRAVLDRYRARVRAILERIYLTPGFMRLQEQEEEFARLLSERAPKNRVREVLAGYGFQDEEKAWENIRSLGLGPSGHLLPPGERRAFVGCIFPMLEVLSNSIDPDLALDHLESFAAATGNRVSFLRALASRRPHLARLSNLLALSNLSHKILTQHPEYFDSLARGIHLHEGRTVADMYLEITERVGASPRGDQRGNVLRRFRQREMIRVAYRDLAELADALEISRELSDLAEAAVRTVLYWTRIQTDAVPDSLCAVALGKLGSKQMHYASDLDLIFLYDAPSDELTPEMRARFQAEQDNRVEQILELMSGVTSEGVTYAMDLRLRPEGTSGLLTRSWESFLDHARNYMQPWERMALIRSRVLDNRPEFAARWRRVLASVVYEIDWEESALEEIRHIKRRIENEKSKESRTHLDFKYGRGGIADLEFLIQFLQIRYGKEAEAVRAPGVSAAVPALRDAGALSETEAQQLLVAHAFQRRVENHYQLMEEWPSQEISRESPHLGRLARSLGYPGVPAAARQPFLGEWDSTAQCVRALVNKHFYNSQVQP